MDCIDRTEVSRALAKAIAYKNCGSDEKAAQWARELVSLLQCAEILTPETPGEFGRRRALILTGGGK